MFDKIFLVENEEEDLAFLAGYISTVFSSEKISIVKDINKAFEIITNDKKEKEGSFAAFIDVYWGASQPRGITLAKSLKKTINNIKCVAYTTVGSNIEFFDELKETFDAIIDKIVAKPHAKAIVVDKIDYEFLNKLFEGHNFLNENDLIQGKEIAKKYSMYIFNIIESERVKGQFLVADFANYSLNDDGKQLRRFEALQNALYKTLKQVDIENKNIIVLPTGDGLVFCSIEDDTPLCIQVAIGLLENLKEYELDRELRIGVHYGRVFLLKGERDEFQIIGPGINKASRVEAASIPGKIMVSDEYYSIIIDRIENGYLRRINKGDRQEIKVKNEPPFFGRFISMGEIGK